MKALKSGLFALTVGLLSANPALATNKNSEIIDACKAAAPAQLGMDNIEVRFKGMSGSSRLKRVLMSVSDENNERFNVQCKISVRSKEIKSFERK